MNIPIQTEGMSDEEYARLVATITEQELMQARSNVGVMFNAPRAQVTPPKPQIMVVSAIVPGSDDPNYLPNLQAFNVAEKLEAEERHNAKKKKCPVCGGLVPYERRHKATCSKECARKRINGTKNKKKHKSKKSRKPGVVKLRTVRTN